MDDCKHTPRIPFFILFKRDNCWGSGEQIRFTCKYCGRTIEPNKQISAKRFSFWMSFSTICVYSIFLREWLMQAFQRIAGIPHIAVHFLVVLVGLILSLLVVNILCFIVLHLIKWKESSEGFAE